MSLQVKQLLEDLKHCNPNSIIKLSNGSNIIHCYCSDIIILSDSKPIGDCDKCGNPIYEEEELKEYKGICPTCDENKYEFEINKR